MSLDVKGRFWPDPIQESIQLPALGPVGVPGICTAPTVEAPSFTGEPPQLYDRFI